MANIDIFGSSGADIDGINSVFTEGSYGRIGVRRVDNWSEASYVEFKVSGMSDDLVFAPWVRYSNGELAPSYSYSYNSSTGYGSVVIPAGVRGAWVYLYSPDDAEYEGSERFTFELIDVGAGDTIIESEQTFTINDNDSPPVQVDIHNASVNEGGIMEFVISTDAPAPEVMWGTARIESVNAETGDVTYWDERSFVFQEGATISSGPILVGTNYDLDRDNETIRVVLTQVGNGFEIGDGVAVGTIIDITPEAETLSFSVLDTSVAAGEVAYFTVEASQAVSENTQVYLRVLSGPVSDWWEGGIIQAGDRSVSIPIPTNVDGGAAGGQIQVELVSYLTGDETVHDTGAATVSESTAGDALPQISIYGPDAPILEGNSGWFTIQTSFAVGYDMTVNLYEYAMDNTQTEEISAWQSVTIKAGELYAMAPVLAEPDDIAEGTQEYRVSIDRVYGEQYTINYGSDSASMTVLDNSAGATSDTLPTLDLHAGSTAYEGQTSNSYATLSHAVDYPVTFTVTTDASAYGHANVNGLGGDYVDLVQQQFTIPAYQTSIPIPVTILQNSNDPEDWAEEYFVLRIDANSVSGASIGQARADILIKDVADTSGQEGGDIPPADGEYPLLSGNTTEVLPGGYDSGRLVIHQPLVAFDSNGDPAKFSSLQGRYDDQKNALGTTDNFSHSGVLAHSFDWGNPPYAVGQVYVVAPARGEIVYRGLAEGFEELGYIVTLKLDRDDGVDTFVTLAHLKAGSIPTYFLGETVEAGAILGEMGGTGVGGNADYWPTHLHMHVGKQLAVGGKWADASVATNGDVPNVAMYFGSEAVIAERHQINSGIEASENLQQDGGWPIGDTDTTPGGSYPESGLFQDEVAVVSSIEATIDRPTFFYVNGYSTVVDEPELVIEGSVDYAQEIFDGYAADEFVFGGKGVDWFTATAGNDVYIGGDGSSPDPDYNQANFYGVAMADIQWGYIAESDTLVSRHAELGIDRYDADVTDFWFNDDLYWKGRSVLIEEATLNMDEFWFA